jgi:hypothetical protein
MAIWCEPLSFHAVQRRGCATRKDEGWQMALIFFVTFFDQAKKVRACRLCVKAVAIVFMKEE